MKKGSLDDTLPQGPQESHYTPAMRKRDAIKAFWRKCAARTVVAVGALGFLGTATVIAQPGTAVINDDSSLPKGFAAPPMIGQKPTQSGSGPFNRTTTTSKALQDKLEGCKPERLTGQVKCKLSLDLGD